MTSGSYAVVFRRGTGRDKAGYQSAAARMGELAAQQAGFLGVGSHRSPDGRA
ncbi:MAG: hypothetical protein KDA37_10925 [Planctomycetales bacterium]|nr:hypothetical protein [Planctomycetales bacterium]